MRQLRNAEAAQRAFSRQLMVSQEGERKRIAAELHDGLAQHQVIIKNLALVGTAEAASTIEFTAEIDNIDDVFPKDDQISVYRAVQ